MVQKQLLIATITIMTVGSMYYTVRTIVRPGQSMSFDFPQGSKVSFKFKPYPETGSSPSEHDHVDKKPVSVTIDGPSYNNLVNELEEEKDSDGDSVDEDVGAEDDRKFSDYIQDPAITSNGADAISNVLVDDPFLTPKRSTVPPSIQSQPKPTRASSTTTTTRTTTTTTPTQTTVRPLSARRSLIRTKLGGLEGVEFDVMGRTVHQFLGIPYARPPIGDLRFRKPVPIRRGWPGRRRRAKKWPRRCITLDEKVAGTLIEQNFTNIEASEDCLYLNIWTPDPNARPRGKDLKPVLIYIHSGGFNAGTASADELNGKILSAFGNIVIVTFNYRLNVFGFFDGRNEGEFTAFHCLIAQDSH